jgi:hypothetical protein
LKASAVLQPEASRLAAPVLARIAAEELSGLDPSAPMPLGRLHTPQKEIELRYEMSSTHTPEESCSVAHQLNLPHLMRKT